MVIKNIYGGLAVTSFLIRNLEPPFWFGTLHALRKARLELNLRNRDNRPFRAHSFLAHSTSVYLFPAHKV